MRQNPALCALWLVMLSLALGCSGANHGSGFDGGGVDGTMGHGGGDGGGDVMTIHLFESGGGETAPCVGLACQQTCSTTAISGRVYDPAGLLPLYNVFVYVPNAPLDPIATGPVCEACQAPASGSPIASATTL